MPRKKRSAGPENDFRSWQQIQEDSRLVGAWWRCQAHGLTTEPVLLGGVAYCPNEDCTARVILVHKVQQNLSAQEWNEGPFKSKKAKEAADDPS